MADRLSEIAAALDTTRENAQILLDAGIVIDTRKPLTIYVCPVCGTWDQSEHYTGGHDFERFPECHRNQRVPVRVFREEDVRPLWAMLRVIAGEPDADAQTGAAYALTRFGAPEEWST